MDAISSAAGLRSPVAPKPEIYYPARSAALSPLSFGRVNDGRPITSQTLLFRLPIELVQEVIAYLNTADLRSLALVDRDCRQLARSRLFTSVVLDYSDKKRALLEKLSRHEAQSRRDNGGATGSPSIGACIRRVTVPTLSGTASSLHRKMPPALLRLAVHNDACDFCGTYLPEIAEALRSSLPNLDEFFWKGAIDIPQYLLMAIASSPIRHLRLHRIQVSPGCEYQLPPPEQQKWALRYIDLRVRWPPYNELCGQEVSKFCLDILKAAAPTLEKLSWTGFEGIKLPFGSSAIRFPRLRALALYTRCMPDDTVLDAFFPTDAENYALCSLSINVPGSGGRESLAKRGRIPGLESLRLCTLNGNPPDSDATDAALLSANPQLKSLTLLARTAEKLNTTLLPLLASEFKFLTTLVVYITSFRALPSEFLATVGRLTSLTSLWIAADECQDWTNVPLIISALSPLRNLARLGLSGRKTTLDSWAHESKDRYKERMRNYVELYVGAFRKLKWIYFGLLVHRVVGNAVVPSEIGPIYYYPTALWESPDW